MTATVVLAVVISLAAGLAAGMVAGRGLTKRAQPFVLAMAETADATAVAVPRGVGAVGSVAGVAESLRDAVDHLEIGVVVTSAVGKVRYRNPAAARFDGTHVGILVDDHVADVVASARSGERASKAAEIHGPPRSWLEFSADPLPDGGVVITIRDVSGRVLIDAMRSDFVTNISHELKTPVGAVAVLAEALIGETDPTVIERLADHLVDEAHRAVTTIDDLLKLSEIESAAPGADVVDLDTVVKRAVERGRAVGVGDPIEISASPVDAGLKVRGDERQLVSALGNLVENAAKYSRPGGVVTIDVTISVDGTWVEVTVADRGVGIPRRDLDRVFERFYRVDRARSRTTGGAGLGLAIVRHVANNHGGTVSVSSQEGEGSTFVLRLPTSLLVDRSVAQVDGVEAAT